MILEFSEKLNIDSAKTIKLPLAESNKKYKLIDVKINAIRQDGLVLQNGFSEVDVVLDTTRILDKVTTGLVSGSIASFNLNQEITAMTDIEVSSRALANITPTIPIEYIDVSFLVSDGEKK